MKAINFLASLDSSNCTSICTGAGLISLCESWAEHLGVDYTNRTYPPGQGIVRNSLLTQNWAEYHERIKNETDRHIPIGLYHDLSDAQNDVLDGCDEPRPNAANTAWVWGPCNPIDDRVEGINNTEMFQEMTPDVISPQNFIDEINNNVVPGSGNTMMDVNDLFDSYLQ